MKRVTATSERRPNSVVWLLQEAIYNSASGDLFHMKPAEDTEQKVRKDHASVFGS